MAEKTLIGVGLPDAIVSGLIQRFAPPVWAFINFPSAQELLQNIANYNATLIFLYNLLPDLRECHELCIALRANPDIETVPILVISHQQDNKEDRLKMLQSGLIDGYVNRDISHEELAAYADVFLQRFALELELEKKNELLNKLSITDELTQLFNRRHLMFALDQELKKSSRYKYPVSCLMLDIDHFKQINDRFGHAVGDIALEKLSGIVRKTMRTIDIACRYGGEEIVIILPHTGFDGANTAAQRLRAKVEQHTFTDTTPPLTFTISIGVISVTENDNPTVDSLFQALDKQLYEAKNTGRNKVIGTDYAVFCQSNPPPATGTP